MKITKTIHYFFLLGITGLFLVAPLRAHALTIVPVRLEISGDPGQSVAKEMTLFNDQDKTVTFYSSFMNFEAQGDSGTPAFVAAKDDIGTWMSTEGSVTLAPKASKIVSIHIAIPSDATPGGHFGVVFWGTAPEKTEPGTLAVTAKTGMLVLLSVNGDVKEAGGLTDFATKDHKFWYNTLPVSFIYHFKNDGGDRVKPEGKITIRDTIFIRAARLDANPVQGNILPGSTRKFQVNWIKNGDPEKGNTGGFFHTVKYQWQNFALGFYSAHMDVVYGANSDKHAAGTAHFFVFPWQLVLVIVLLVIIVFWGGRRLLRRYNRHIIRQARIRMQKE